MRLTDINFLATPEGLELVKGRGYFYWVNTANNVEIPSVYTNAFSHLEMSEWLEELKSAIKIKNSL